MSTLRITGIQSNLHWEDKAANLKMFEEKINSISEKTEIIILPEMFSTGFSMYPAALAERMDGPTVEWMNNIALRKKIILTGSVIIEDNGHFFNRLIWMQPNGQYGFYDKRHRFAFAGEDLQYTSGDKRLIASVNGWRINLQVCYDLRFPVWARQRSKALDELPGNVADTHSMVNAEIALAAAEYDVLIYVANWPEKRINAWKTLLRARAIENQCFVIGVNRVGNDGSDIYHSGDSMVIDPLGEIIYEAGIGENIFTCALNNERLEEVRTKFPFWKDADHFLIEP